MQMPNQRQNGRSFLAKLIKVTRGPEFDERQLPEKRRGDSVPMLVQQRGVLELSYSSAPMSVARSEEPVVVLGRDLLYRASQDKFDDLTREFHVLDLSQRRNSMARQTRRRVETRASEAARRFLDAERTSSSYEDLTKRRAPAHKGLVVRPRGVRSEGKIASTSEPIASYSRLASNDMLRLVLQLNLRPGVRARWQRASSAPLTWSHMLKKQCLQARTISQSCGRRVTKVITRRCFPRSADQP